MANNSALESALGPNFASRSRGRSVEAKSVIRYVACPCSSGIETPLYGLTWAAADVQSFYTSSTTKTQVGARNRDHSGMTLPDAEKCLAAIVVGSKMSYN
jgi:hypothetical protein